MVADLVLRTHSKASIERGRCRGHHCMDGVYNNIANMSVVPLRVHARIALMFDATSLIYERKISSPINESKAKTLVSWPAFMT